MNRQALRSAITANIGALADARRVLDAAAAHGPLAQTVGPQLRHALEHYQAFMAGLAGGAVYYDRRPRNTALESDPVQAAGALDAITDALASLECDPDQPLRVVVECPLAGTEVDIASTAGRELHYLLTHCIHHFALMRQILAATGIAVPSTFGVAPATVRHGARTSA